MAGVETSTTKLRPKLKAEKEDDPDCQLFVAHGPALTKVTQRYMIDRLGDDWVECHKPNQPKDKVNIFLMEKLKKRVFHKTIYKFLELFSLHRIEIVSVF